MTRWFHDLISSLLSAKWMSESKSAPKIALEGSRTRKKPAKVIDLIWPQLTSVDLRKNGWPVECMSTTWYSVSTFISLAKTAMFASYVPRNAFSAWHDPSYDGIGQMLPSQQSGSNRERDTGKNPNHPSRDFLVRRLGYDTLRTGQLCRFVLPSPEFFPYFRLWSPVYFRSCLWEITIEKGPIQIPNSTHIPCRVGQSPVFPVQPMENMPWKESDPECDWRPSPVPRSRH